MNAEREALFLQVETELQGQIDVYPLARDFEGLEDDLAMVTMLDVTKVQGCHYGVKNVFVPIIRHLEETGYEARKGIIMPVSPKTTILIESSTGNGWVAAYNAAQYLGYEFRGVMPAGMSSENRYKHPDGWEVEVIRTPAEKYARGMKERLQAITVQNGRRLARGEKIYVPLNHAIAAADITLKTMSEIGQQLLAKLGKVDVGVLSMGNGASLCSIGEVIKEYCPEAQIIAAESFASGIGFDRFAAKRGLPSYQQLFGIQTEHPDLMSNFSMYGTNVSIGTKLPLQERAFNGDLLDGYYVVADGPVMKAYMDLGLDKSYVKNASGISNLSTLPSVLYNRYGNSTLANISVARRFTGKGKIVVAMAYDGRGNY